MVLRRTDGRHRRVRALPKRVCPPDVSKSAKLREDRAGRCRGGCRRIRPGTPGAIMALSGVAGTSADSCGRVAAAFLTSWPGRRGLPISEHEHQPDGHPGSGQDALSPRRRVADPTGRQRTEPLQRGAAIYLPIDPQQLLLTGKAGESDREDARKLRTRNAALE